MKNTSLLFTVGISPLLMASCNTKAEQQKITRPNIIYILADDMGHGDVSAFNAASTVPTPCLDSMVNSGITFTDAHSNSSVSTPTRYGTLTGRYCFRSKLKQSVLVGLDSALIESGRMTVASLLRDNGYKTACIGKWHLGLNWPAKDPSKPLFTGDKWDVQDTGNVDFEAALTGGPNDNGFDYSFILPSSLDIPPYVYIENGRITAPVTKKTEGWAHKKERGMLFRAGDIADDFDPLLCLQKTTEKSIEFIKNAAQEDKPFFLYFPLTAPHTPWVPSDEFKGKSGAGTYGDFVCMVDDVVRKIYNALQESGQAENTLVIFTADNGAWWRPKDIELTNHRANHPFSGMKSDLWEGGHHVPFIATWPGVVKPNTTSSDVICSTDLLATCAELVGVQLPHDAGEDSFSFFKILTDTPYDKPLREATIHHSDPGLFALRKGDWVFVDCHGSGGWTLPEGEAVNTSPAQLYNLKDDIKQQNNLVEQYPDKATELKLLLDRYVEDGRSRPE